MSGRILDSWFPRAAHCTNRHRKTRLGIQHSALPLWIIQKKLLQRCDSDIQLIVVQLLQRPPAGDDVELVEIPDLVDRALVPNLDLASPHLLVRGRNLAQGVRPGAHAPEAALRRVLALDDGGGELGGVTLRAPLPRLVARAPNVERLGHGVPHAVVLRRKVAVAGQREEHLKQAAGEDIDGLDVGRELDVVAQREECVVRLVLARLHVAPVEVPRRGNEDLDARALSRAQEEQVALELQLGDTEVCADDRVDARAPAVERGDVVVVRRLHKALELAQLIGRELDGVAAEDADPVAPREEAVGDLLAEVASTACYENEHLPLKELGMIDLALRTNAS